MTKMPWRCARAVLLAAGMAGALFAGGARAAGQDANLPIYKMVRSLEDIQDQIVAGDLQASDMQRFMLGEIDRRLRDATPDDFKDLRNVDAAMIYAMSGGNPATLDLLVSRDVPGNFDSRVTNALMIYLAGKGSMAAKGLEETVPEYKTTAIGPYLALVAANAIMQRSPAKALEYFNWARLVLPGTIVEEAALRRSLLVTAKTNDVPNSIAMARRYMTRFPLSPYAAQVAEQFVALVKSHYGEITNDQIADTLENFEPKRRQEVYLRIARMATVTGRLALAKFAATEAIALSDGKNDSQAQRAQLYLGLSVVPTADIATARSDFADIPDEILGPREKKLREAGEFILSEVEKPAAMGNSLAQGDKANDAANVKAKSEDASLHTPPNTSPNSQASAPATVAKDKVVANSVDTFLSKGQAQLDAIDAMIKKGDM